MSNNEYPNFLEEDGEIMPAYYGINAPVFPGATLSGAERGDELKAMHPELQHRFYPVSGKETTAGPVTTTFSPNSFLPSPATIKGTTPDTLARNVAAIREIRNEHQL